MEIQQDMSKLRSWSKQDEDPFKNTEQADEGCSTNDFSVVHGKGKACHDAPDEKVLKTSVVLICRVSPHFRTQMCHGYPSLSYCVWI